MLQSQQFAILFINWLSARLLGATCGSIVAVLVLDSSYLICYSRTECQKVDIALIMIPTSETLS